MTRDAAEQSRRLSLPQKPEEYKVALPTDFKPPEGMQFSINGEDPALPRIQQYAHKHHLSQDQVTELVAEYAGIQVAQAQSREIWIQTEIQKLGAIGFVEIVGRTDALRPIGTPSIGDTGNPGPCGAVPAIAEPDARSYAQKDRLFGDRQLQPCRPSFERRGSDAPCHVLLPPCA